MLELCLHFPERIFLRHQLSCRFFLLGDVVFSLLLEFFCNRLTLFLQACVLLFEQFVLLVQLDVLMTEVVFLLLLLHNVLFDFPFLLLYGFHLLSQVFVLYEQLFLLALRLHLLCQRNVLVSNRVVSLLFCEHSVLVNVLQIVHRLV